ncbi:MAG: Ribonuclease [Candidatus Thorarchaeota archaeon AB_25]|nr:MAG: Ribonuclease [Candidatus Thorarchaeota archaeon AB_25]
MTTKKGIPKTKNKKIKEVFNQATSDVDRVKKGEKVPDEKGPFNESREFIAFEVAKATETPVEGLTKAEAADIVLMEIFRDARDDPTPADIIQSMTLCMYGLILGNYNKEDFRYLYRYSLRHARNQNQIESWLRKALVFLAATKHESANDVMSEVRIWLQFLGAPVFSPRLFSDVGDNFDVDIKSVLDSENLKLVDALTRHPQYVREAVEGKPFMEVMDACREWTPDVLLSELLEVAKERVYSEAENLVTQDMSVSDSIDVMKKHFEKNQFQSHKSTVLPVRLQQLKEPPPGEAIDPVIFELIPQKLRMGLLPSVAYSSKTKRIEIIFLGGPGIGRSGIIIKTDTGGVLLDFGLSVANHMIPEWVPELEMIDTILVSHAHLDHVGGLPVLFDKFDGKWCSVGPTGGISKVLLTDAIKVGTPLPPRRYNKLDRISRFNEDNIKKVTDNHVRLEYGRSNEVGPGIVVTPVDACHIPGSAAYSIDIEGVKILYTGDFNIDESVLFPGANIPTDSDYVIFDGTYWGREDFDRKEVSETISEVVSNYGPVIIPSFAVGRSQEMLMILENLGLTKNRNVIVAGMADRITNLVGVQGHWQSLKKNKVHLDKDDILVAGGGMMGGGLARYHFGEHRNNPNAAVILCGYLAPRTPGWNLLHGYEPHECKLEYARLSAHSSATNLQTFVSSCTGKKIMVHTPTEKAPKGIIVPEYRERITIKP